MDKSAQQIIHQCRDQVSDIDRQIFHLIKQREQLSAQIGFAKRKLAIPDRDLNREKAVFDQAMALANELNLPEHLALSVQKLIVEASLSRQEQDRIKNSFGRDKKSVAIIGGSGRLGQWLCHFFVASGHNVTVVDKNPPTLPCAYTTALDDALLDHDIIIVATPIRASIGILDQLASFKPKKPVIFDVSSVKAPVHKALLNLADQGAKVTSLHPMFGPSVNLLFGKHIIRTSLNIREADEMVNEIFRATSLKLLDMSIDEHDAIIAVLLSLSHVINIVFARTLEKSGFAINKLLGFSSPTFSNLIAIAKKVALENPHLYFEIQALNPHTKEIHKQLSLALAQTMHSMQSLDEEAFVNIMSDTADYLFDSGS